MWRFVFFILYIALFAASCTPQITPVVPAAEEISSDLALLPPVTPSHAEEVRLGLVGKPQDLNVWQLFSGKNTGYADYAPRSEFWTRLYHLTPSDLSLVPRAAQGLPAGIVQDGEFFVSTANLRRDLKWTDGTPLTAEDVAFTANIALTFELGFEWAARYPREFLLRAESLDAHTVKFIFKKKPNVGVWQYGVLQGMIVQKNFWETRIETALPLLPKDSLKVEIENARIALATVHSDIARLTKEISELRSAGQSNRGLDIQLTQRQRQLDFAQNELDRLSNVYGVHIQEAHQVLYALSDANEPTLGAWKFESYKDKTWVNAANPDFPLGKPNFNRAVYYIFENEKDALTAYQNGKVDFILSQNGISQAVTGARRYPTYSARFLLFNPSKPEFASPNFQRALGCLLDRKHLAGNVLKDQAAPLSYFILSPQWHDPKIKDDCEEMSRPERINAAVKILKSAGYKWSRTPSPSLAGQILTSPDGRAFPNVMLSTPSKQADPLRYAAAQYIAEEARFIGIPVSVKEMQVEDVLYAVFSSRQYDAAILGWKLSEYPGYLCEWFDGGNSSLHLGSQFAHACSAFEAESNFEAAKKAAGEIESALVSAPPMIPLFVVNQIEAYQNISFPAREIWNGWGSLYSAPFYAIPSP